MGYEIRYGDVWNGNRHICGPSDLLAVVFDEENGTLHKHGRADLAKAWLDATRAKFLERGFDELAASLTVIEFPVTSETLAELNACTEATGRVVYLADTLRKIGETLSVAAKTP